MTRNTGVTIRQGIRIPGLDPGTANLGTEDASTVPGSALRLPGNTVPLLKFKPYPRAKTRGLLIEVRRMYQQIPG
ncbi:MAG: hypothetical protein AAFR20_12075, partial [Pseudomonadota bacterium]